MQKTILAISCLFASLFVQAADSSASLWNQGWRFQREAPPPTPPVLDVAAADLLGQGDFPNGPAAQSATFARREVRYVALEAISSQQPGESFTSLAELDLLGADGQPLPRAGWKVVFADSEETHDENGRAANILDGKPGTIWHTAYSAGQAKPPHAVAIDLGAPQAVAGLRCLPRQSNTPGMIKGWQLYGKLSPIVPAKPAATGIPALPAEATAGFADAGWEAVSLPHTPKIEQPMESGRHFQGLCWYRKTFRTEKGWSGKKIQVRFDGAMQIAEVWLNGKPLTVHQGGYLPFIIDLTPGLAPEGGNVLAVRLDNRNAPAVPPGKPLASMDFTYFGGLYRNATLLVSDPLHISDVFEANQVAGGGIFVRTESLTEKEASIVVRADVRNDGKADAPASIRFTILNPDRGEPSVTLEATTVPAGKTQPFTAQIKMANPRLWTPDQPTLYTLKTELCRNGKVLQTITTRFGIRKLAYDDKLGFVLNGTPLLIRGANRHQDFPWLGNALADNVQYRDLKRLKEAGFNFLRLAHYPQSEAVMDACDELGLMVAACTPGWQWWSNDPQFATLARQNIREMVRWHRNHPCAIMWEVSLNETYGKDPFHAECCRIAREEYPGGQLFTCGDSYGSRDVSHYDIPYCGWPGNGYNRPAAPGFEGRKRSFIREYGDNDSGLNTRIAIGGGADHSEKQQLSQAWAHQWTHNVNNRWDWHVGDAIWVGVDHFRGCGGNAPISTCGVLDWLRQPKFSYYFFQSQRIQELPAIFIPNYWTPRPSPAKVVVYSNCDEVELRLNGKTIARQKPDAGADSRMGDPKPEEAMLTNYMKTGKSVQDFEKMIEERRKQGNRAPIYTGGDCQHLDHAPFTFPLVPFEAGELKAIGYIKGKKTCEFARHTPGQPVGLRLVAETLGRDLAADGADAIFVRAQIIDTQGEVVPDANVPVRFAVTGPGRIVSPAQAKSENDGIATLLLQAGTAPGKITVSATAEGLKTAKLSLKSR
jgi:beta-galactosidase